MGSYDFWGYAWMQCCLYHFFLIWINLGTAARTQCKTLSSLPSCKPLNQLITMVARIHFKQWTPKFLNHCLILRRTKAKALTWDTLNSQLYHKMLIQYVEKPRGYTGEYCPKGVPRPKTWGALEPPEGQYSPGYPPGFSTYYNYFVILY